jgi:uncharacterized membrane protein YraQ (UPF0718 family)
MIECTSMKIARTIGYLSLVILFVQFVPFAPIVRIVLTAICCIVLIGIALSLSKAHLAARTTATEKPAAPKKPVMPPTPVEVAEQSETLEVVDELLGEEVVTADDHGNQQL